MEREKEEKRIELVARVGLFFACCDGDFDATEQSYLKKYLVGLCHESYREQLLSVVRRGDSLEQMFESLVSEFGEFCSQLKTDEKEEFVAQLEVFIDQLVNKDKNVDASEVYYLNVWKKTFVTNAEQKDIVRYRKWYTEEGFWNAIKKTCLKFGNSVLKDIFVLYYALQDESVDTVAKLWIGGALGYFILPLDLIPDIFPGGWLDDIAFIAYVIKRYASVMPSAVITRAELKVSELKGTLD